MPALTGHCKQLPSLAPLRGAMPILLRAARRLPRPRPTLIAGWPGGDQRLRRALHDGFRPLACGVAKWLARFGWVERRFTMKARNLGLCELGVRDQY